MRTVMLANLKGGSGKSLLAVHLAVGLQKAVDRLEVFDTDQQLTAYNWFERREHDEPVVRSVFPSRAEAELERCRREGVAVVVIDTPAQNAEVLTLAYPLADLIVVPVRPTVSDLASLMRTLRLVAPEQRTVRVEVVINGTRAQGRDAGDTARVCREVFGVMVMEPMIVDRVGYFRAMTPGLTVFETEQGSKGDEEMRSFVEHVAGALAEAG